MNNMITSSGDDKRYTFDDLRLIMARLRDPENGCPWDIEQDFKSIAPYTIEEAYEVADAIERDSMDDLREELGDLLLQPIYHAQMATEERLFDINDVVHDITAKMVRRHPHVFGDGNADHPDDVNEIWAKEKEKEAQKKNSKSSALDGVPLNFPALLRAYKLQKNAEKMGFAWQSTDGVLDKLSEEIQELRSAIDNNDKDNIEEEIGDILFVLVNFAKRYDVNAETALRRANDKFVRRFQGMEADALSDGRPLSETDTKEMLALWQKQKAK